MHTTTLLSLFLGIFYLSQAATVQKAIAILTPVSPGASGIVRFEKTSETETTVTVTITGMTINPDALHGLHITQFGDLRGLINSGFDSSPPGANVAGAKSLGAHFNPTNAAHGCPPGLRQAGDLGNWQATTGGIQLTKTFTGLDLTGANSIIGRGIMLLEGADDCTTESGTAYAVGTVGIERVAAGDVNEASAPTSLTSGVCVLRGTSNCNTSVTNCGFGVGLVRFYQVNTNDLLVQAQLNNWQTGSGIHVHTYGDLSSADGSSVGPHYNRNNQQHGLPKVNLARHTGDMGYLFVVDTNAFFDFEFNSNNTASANGMIIPNIIGRSVIVHGMVDHGRDGEGCTTPEVNGAAGAMMFQCVIGIPNHADPATAGNALPTPRVLELPNDFEGSDCVDPTPTPTPTPEDPSISFVTTDLDCVNDRVEREYISDRSLCQANPNGYYYRLECSSSSNRLTNSAICDSSDCSTECRPLVGLPGICNVDGFGGAYRYDCNSGANLFMSLSALFSLVSVWILVAL